ncbi:MAG: autotransporter outer membrane beta-barrel domain-containing protein [Pseudomonadota bacterium]
MRSSVPPVAALAGLLSATFEEFMARLAPIRIALPSLLLLGSVMPSYAVNPGFQDFFFSVCASAEGALAARCAETNGGLGDLSGDSESSLNPSQTLGLTNPARSANATRASDARDQGFETRSAFGNDNSLSLGRFSLILNARAGEESFDRTVDVDRERAYDQDNHALQVGVDYRLNDRTQLGGWVTWEDHELRFVNEQPGRNFAPQGSAGVIDRSAIGGVVFATTQFDNGVFLDAAAGLSRDDYDIERRSIFQESNRVIETTAINARASTSGTERWLGVTLGYTLQRSAWTVEPYGALTASQVDVDGYQERDSASTGLALAIEDTSNDTLTGTLGLRVAGTFSGKGFVVLPQLRLEALHEFDTDAAASRVRFVGDAGNNTLNLRGAARDESYANLGVGAALVLPRGFSAFVEYQTLVGAGDLDRWIVSGGIRLEL